MFHLSDTQRLLQPSDTPRLSIVTLLTAPEPRACRLTELHGGLRGLHKVG